MAFTDLIYNRSLSHPVEFGRRLSFSDDFQEKKRRQPKINRLHTSVLDLLHWHQPADSKNTNQQEISMPQRPSIIKSSDIARAISKKSVTFASVFDLEENEDEKDYLTFDLEANNNNNNNEMGLEEDLVTIVPNKQIDEEATINSESYPFRSEIPLHSFAFSNSPNDVISSSQDSRRRSIQHFLQNRHPKKLHPIKSIDLDSVRIRSTSVPNIAFAPPSILQPSTAAAVTPPRNPPKKSIRSWFKSSSLGRFVQSLIKRPHRSNISEVKTNSLSQSTTLRSDAELIY